MKPKVKLLIDKDLKHVVGAYAELRGPVPTNPPAEPEANGAVELPVRNSPLGELMLPSDQLQLEDMPTQQEPLEKEVLADPRSYVFTEKQGSTQESVHAPERTFSINRLEDKQLVLRFEKPDVPVEPKVRVKAYVKARGKPDSPRLFTSPPLLDLEDVLSDKDQKEVYVPFKLDKHETYDVLVLVEDYAAALAEGIKVT